MTYKNLLFLALSTIAVLVGAAIIGFSELFQLRFVVAGLLIGGGLRAFFMNANEIYNAMDAEHRDTKSDRAPVVARPAVLEGNLDQVAPAATEASYTVTTEVPQWGATEASYAVTTEVPQWGATGVSYTVTEPVPPKESAEDLLTDKVAEVHRTEAAERVPPHVGRRATQGGRRAASASVAARVATTEVARRPIGQAGDMLADAADQAREELMQRAERAGEQMQKSAAEGFKDLAREAAETFTSAASDIQQQAGGPTNPQRRPGS